MGTSGLELPRVRPDSNGRAALFVPSLSVKEDVLVTVRTGAAIVGFSEPDGSLVVYFESNRFHDPALQKWEHKARKAYERLTDNVPTVSKMAIDADNFEQVGYIDGKGITIQRMEIVQRWLTLSGVAATAPEAASIAWLR